MPGACQSSSNVHCMAYKREVCFALFQVLSLSFAVVFEFPKLIHVQLGGMQGKQSAEAMKKQLLPLGRSRYVLMCSCVYAVSPSWALVHQAVAHKQLSLAI